MKIFTDNQGREWQIAITVDSIRRVRDLLTVDLCQPFAGDPPLLTRLDTDIVLLCDVIYCLVKPQADERNLTSEQFGASLGGDAIRSAHDGLMEEWEAFFQSLRRAEMAKAIQKQAQIVKTMVDLTSHKVDEIDVTLATEQLRNLDVNQAIQTALAGSTPGG